MRRAEEICDGIVEEGLDISWGASSRVDTITRRLAEKMRRAGCWILYLGIESGCQRILDAIGKRITIEQIRRAVRIVKQVGIKVLGSFILGFPWDNMESMKQTVSFARSLDLDYAQFSILTPYPGTPIFNYALQNNLLLTRDWSRYTALEPVMRVRGVTGKQLKSLLRRAYIGFYLRPRIIWSWLRDRQFPLIKSSLKAVLNYIRGL